jgi:hypothetical protein
MMMLSYLLVEKMAVYGLTKSKKKSSGRQNARKTGCTQMRLVDQIMDG